MEAVHVCVYLKKGEMSHFGSPGHSEERTACISGHQALHKTVTTTSFKFLTYYLNFFLLCAQLFLSVLTLSVSYVISLLIIITYVFSLQVEIEHTPLFSAGCV